MLSDKISQPLITSMYQNQIPGLLPRQLYCSVLSESDITCTMQLKLDKSFIIIFRKGFTVDTGIAL